ncbi:hypothetical protein RF11_15082 [Thelohanellus kitauei]|uniref:Sortilin C-terminal domain-containing protein n=1 Tax=Thelohanellus kitauei TaxID=669202 RepID=A0A0C2J198_THEKT|nr:hypothetical protein RF11_15082 [Thelohanellus kitauei]
MGKYNKFASVWFGELNDLVFSKISTHIVGVALDDHVLWDLFDQIQFYVALIDRLTGIIFVSYTIANGHEELKKHTVISYNYGNTFLPVKYKTENGMCEIVKYCLNQHECELFIPPNKNRLATSIKTAKNNPLVMVAKCILIKHGNESLPRSMISTDGGYSWGQVH